ncbi:flagellar export protein FliJ [Enterobacillus tribolii]|uniref:Flagellar FliJ protein n=1 Tax=Enterobacillus tribolii TaxID=1487935 RepID=A0A370R2X7_9GAMM|nr:flagellar export protein FliJ [Enterobacillus tribolii]MBW7984788.1 flagella biosynthesis chaperone FliJ [Enterobacillus tribolii]RDK96789.1 flagellar FliJ protein [Enterobacillus tribolii]
MSSSLLTLKALAQKAVEQAVVSLGRTRRSRQQVEQQLNALLAYQDEYRNRLYRDMSSGINAASWHNYQQFIQALEQAIMEYRRQLQQWDGRLNQATRLWQEKQQRLNAFSTLNERAEQALMLQQNKQEQKRTDEFAQHAAMRRTKL